MEVNDSPWCEKYRARSFDEIRGQDLAIDKVRAFLRKFPAKKALVLHGPAGVGKTSMAYAIALEMDAEILELNASDLRDREKISKIVGPASSQKSLFRKNKIILMDEIDGVSATRDKGGLGEVLSIIEKTAFPMILTANDIWQKKFNLLRRKAELVELKEADYKTILKILMEVCEKENCVVSGDVLKSIAIRSRGDIRAAINDLQMLSKMDSKELVKEIGERDKEQSIFSAMQYVFKNARINEEMLRVFNEVNMPLDEIFLWIDENIPEEYSGEELARAYFALALADVFRGRIRRQRHWRFMVYEHFFLGPAIASVKKYNRSGWTSYKKPSRILKIWLSNQRMAKKKSICEKYARSCHTSVRAAMKDFLLLRFVLKNPAVREELGLSDEEKEFLDKKI
ncbi:replication factor C large subunit [Candidatus Pacearchaeota archaeon]|nr:MAG: replication factor C large subunit [Candidatus Pacearchaeota archaeon]